MQPYLLKNSSTSTLLLLLRVAEAEKVNDLYIGLIVVFYNSRGLVFIPESKHESYSSMIRYNFLTEKKTFLI